MSFAIGDIRVDRIVEQEGPVFDPLTFFPTLTREVLEENRAGWSPQRSTRPPAGWCCASSPG